jgi:ketosteroid isomerase-like protein
MILRPSSLSLLLLLTLAGASVADGQVRPIPQSNVEQDRMRYNAEMMEDYQSLLRSWSRAMMQGNVRAATSLFAEDAVLLHRPGEPAHGREAIQQSLHEISSNWSNLRFGLLDFEASGWLMYGFGSYEFEGGGGSQLESVSGSYILILQRAGRTLRIRSLTFLPPAA